MRQFSSGDLLCLPVSQASIIHVTLTHCILNEEEVESKKYEESCLTRDRNMKLIKAVNFGKKR